MSRIRKFAPDALEHVQLECVAVEREEHAQFIDLDRARASMQHERDMVLAYVHVDVAKPLRTFERHALAKAAHTRNRPDAPNCGNSRTNRPLI